MLRNKSRHWAERDVHDHTGDDDRRDHDLRDPAHMPIAVMIESSENTMSMTMIWTITRRTRWRACAILVRLARLDFAVDFVVALPIRNSPPPIRMMSRHENSRSFTVSTGCVSPINQTRRLSRRMRNFQRQQQPDLPCPCCLRLQDQTR